MRSSDGELFVFGCRGLRLRDGSALEALRILQAFGDRGLTEGTEASEAGVGGIVGHGDGALLVPLLLALQADGKGTSDRVAQTLTLKMVNR